MNVGMFRLVFYLQRHCGVLESDDGLLGRGVMAENEDAHLMSQYKLN
jgi:hypothetical protein